MFFNILCILSILQVLTHLILKTILWDIDLIIIPIL